MRGDSFSFRWLEHCPPHLIESLVPAVVGHVAFVASELAVGLLPYGFDYGTTVVVEK